MAPVLLIYKRFALFFVKILQIAMVGYLMLMANEIHDQPTFVYELYPHYTCHGFVVRLHVTHQLQQDNHLGRNPIMCTVLILVLLMLYDVNNFQSLNKSPFLASFPSHNSYVVLVVGLLINDFRLLTL